MLQIALRIKNVIVQLKRIVAAGADAKEKIIFLSSSSTLGLNDEIAKLLIVAGANTENTYGKLVLDYASQPGKEEIRKLLLDASANISDAPQREPLSPQNEALLRKGSPDGIINEAWLVEHGLDPAKNWSNVMTPHGLTYGQIYLLTVGAEKNKD